MTPPFPPLAPPPSPFLPKSTETTSAWVIQGTIIGVFAGLSIMIVMGIISSTKNRLRELDAYGVARPLAETSTPQQPPADQELPFEIQEAQGSPAKQTSPAGSPQTTQYGL